MNLKSFSTFALALSSLGFFGGRAAAVDLTGAGATFPNPIYSKWFAEYKKVDPSVSFNYQPIGSGGGQKQILEGTVDFGASDGPMSDASLAKAPSKNSPHPDGGRRGGDHLQLAWRGTSLQLDGLALADIYLGKITKWNDAAIAKLNVGSKLPATDIAVAHTRRWQRHHVYLHRLPRRGQFRMEGQGRQAEHDGELARRSSAAKGNEGVAGFDQADARFHRLRGTHLRFCKTSCPSADIKNADGEYVKADARRRSPPRIGDSHDPGRISASRWSTRPARRVLPHRGCDLVARLCATTQRRRQGRQALVEFLKWARQGRREHETKDARLRRVARERCRRPRSLAIESINTINALTPKKAEGRPAKCKSQKAEGTS